MLRTTSGFSSGGVYLPRTGKSRDSGQNDTRSKTFEGGIFFLSINVQNVSLQYFYIPSFNITKNPLFALNWTHFMFYQLALKFCLILRWATWHFMYKLPLQKIIEYGIWLCEVSETWQSYLLVSSWACFFFPHF